jgi:phage gp36-like protein
MAYATTADLETFGVPPGVLSSVDPATQEAALAQASAFADKYLRDQYTLPLSAPYDPALVDIVVRVACWRLMSRRGFSPQSGTDTAFRINYEDAVTELTAIANGRQRLAVVQAAPEYEEPMVLTSPPRGYTEYAGIDGPIGPYEGGL